MRRKGGFKKRQLPPDYKYNNPLVTKFINYIMLDGKKSIARTIVYDAFSIIEAKTKEEAMDVFDKAIKNVAPTLEVKTKRIGGANYQVPLQVRGDRRIILSMRWIRDAARAQKGKAMSERLANELMAAAKEEGEAVRKKELTEKMARANRAFAHFA